MNYYTQKQKGSIYLTVILLGVILAVAIGVVSLVVSGANLVKGLGDSVRAFHIADSGMELALYEIRKEGSTQNINCGVFFADYGITTCSVTIEDTGNIKIKSLGSYNGSQRRIEADY